MAKRTWVGGAAVQAQAATSSITGYDAASTYQLIVTGEDGSTTTIQAAANTDAATTAGLLRTTWQNSLSRLVKAITIGGSGANLTFTAVQPGVPFVVAKNVSGGTGTMASVVVGTPNSGPSDYGCAANWAEGAVPAAGDDVRITGTDSILYGLDQSGVELHDFLVDASYTGTLGGLAAFLKVDLDNAHLFQFASQNATGYVDLGSANISPRVVQTARASTGGAGLYLTGSNLATVHVLGGNVRIVDGATVATLLVSAAAACTVEAGATLTTLRTAGTTTLNAAATTVAVSGGTCVTEGVGAITTLSVEGGTCTPNSSGTIATLKVLGGLCDFLKSQVARAITNAPQVSGGELRYDPAILTLGAVPAQVGALSVKRAG